jgi:serine phosphatase RsbU (regulator of sigma subunit)
MSEMHAEPSGDGNPMNSLAYKLERLATKLSKTGNMEGAILALRRANEVGDGVGTRLAKYLQRAGRYQEALSELDALAKSQRRSMVARVSHRPKSERDEAVASILNRLYADAALIARRQKDAVQESVFLKHAAEQNEIVMQLRALNEERRRQIRREIEEAKSDRKLYHRLLKKHFPSRR